VPETPAVGVDGLKSKVTLVGRGMLDLVTPAERVPGMKLAKSFLEENMEGLKEGGTEAPALGWVEE